MCAPSSFVLAVLTLHVSAMGGCSAVDLPAAQPSHRRLLQDTNLAARPEANIPEPAAARVPSQGSGSFLASSSPRGGHHPTPKEVAPPAAAGSSPHRPSKWLTSMRWLYLTVLPAAGLLLLAGIACWLLPCRKSAVATIGPWKTGLSGQLQKAFVTGATLFAASSYMCSDILFNTSVLTKIQRIKFSIAMLILWSFHYAVSLFLFFRSTLPFKLHMGCCLLRLTLLICFVLQEYRNCRDRSWNVPVRTSATL